MITAALYIGGYHLQDVSNPDRGPIRIPWAAPIKIMPVRDIMDGPKEDSLNYHMMIFEITGQISDGKYRYELVQFGDCK